MSGRALRALMEAEEVIFAPGTWDALSALLAEKAGFRAINASGFAIAASLGLPDAELYTMTENTEAVRRMAAVTTVPIIADCDTGYGNAVNAMRAVREFERAGASAIFIEDQKTPKRCPISVADPVPVVSRAEAVGKIRAALDARSDESFVVIARCDATGEDAMERVVAYAEAGADLIFPVSKTFTTFEAMKACREACGKPLMLSLTPSTWVEREFTRERCVDAGVKLACFPFQTLYAAVTGLRTVLDELKRTEYGPAASKGHIGHKEFIEIIGFPEIEELQLKYLPALQESAARAI
jgi:methylisocitrate lyase